VDAIRANGQARGDSVTFPRHRAREIAALRVRHDVVVSVGYDSNMVPRSARARRRFLAESGAFLAGTSVLVSACSSGEPTSPTPAEDRLGTIALNHGHVAVITAAQLAAGGPLRLEIQGASPHGHAVELSADAVARIRRSEVVSVLSSAGWEDKHDHRVTFNA
jgi:hypothetical protein